MFDDLAEKVNISSVILWTTWAIVTHKYIHQLVEICMTSRIVGKNIRRGSGIRHGLW